MQRLVNVPTLPAQGVQLRAELRVLDEHLILEHVLSSGHSKRTLVESSPGRSRALYSILDGAGPVRLKI